MENNLYESSIIESRLVNVYNAAEREQGNPIGDQSICKQETSSIESMVTE